MTTLKNNAQNASASFEPIVKPIAEASLGRAQVAVSLCELSALPAGFVLPEVSEMGFGDKVCDHDCDVEHIQTVDGTELVTSIIWTTDGGVGLFDNPIGWEWIARVSIWDESQLGQRWVTHVDCREDLVEVILDCGMDVDEDVAIATARQLLADAIGRRL